MTTIRRRSASPEDWLDTATHIADGLRPPYERNYAIAFIAKQLAVAFAAGELSHFREDLPSIQEDLRHERA